jgi:hypothetical protein
MTTVMLHRNGSEQRGPAAPKIDTLPAKGMVDCDFCGAPNGAHREGCFNCGGLLGTRQEARELVRSAMGLDGQPGRVVYAAPEIPARSSTVADAPNAGCWRRER